MVRKINSYVVWAGMLLISASFACFTQSASSHPTDEQLEKIFRQNKSDFEKLIEMCNHDVKVVRIAPDFTWLEDNLSWPRPISELGFSEDRWNEYRLIFKKLGLSKGIARRLDTETIYLIASTEGLLTGGSSKGYAYSKKELHTIDGSLDDYERSSSKKIRPAYKRIDENWYLYYDFE